MKEKNLELKVGIFVVLAIVIITFSYIWMKQISVRKEGYKITIIFDDATGLKRGDPIWVHGVTKGKVLSIDLIEDEIITHCYLESDIILKKDTRAMIKDVALISGTKYIEFFPGKDKELFDISKPIKGIGAPAFSLGELGTILNPIRDIAKKINSGDIAKTLDNINLLSEQLALLVKENRAGIKRTVRNVEDDLKKFNSVALKLSENLEHLSVLLNKMNKGEGTAGKLMKDEALYNEMEATLKETQALIKDIRENPKKYINVRIF